MDEVKATALVEGFQKLLIEGIALRMPEANQIQGGRCRQLEMFGGFDQLRKILCHFNVLFDVITQSFDSVVANDKPELQGAETPPQWNLPVSIIDDGS